MLLAKESCPPEVPFLPWGAAYVQWLVNAGLKGLSHILAPKPTPASILDNSERYPSYRAPCGIGWSFCCNRKNSSPQLLFQKMLSNKSLTCVSLLVYFLGNPTQYTTHPVTVTWGGRGNAYLLLKSLQCWVCLFQHLKFHLNSIIKKQETNWPENWRPESSYIFFF